MPVDGALLQILGLQREFSSVPLVLLNGKNAVRVFLTVYHFVRLRYS